MKEEGRHEKGRPFAVEPEKPRPGGIPVRIAATGVCHTDLIARDQRHPVPLPAVLGHEGAGVVPTAEAPHPAGDIGLTTR